MEEIFEIIRELFDKDTPLEEILNTKLDLKDEKVIGMVEKILTEVYNEKMPFNKYLGIMIKSMSAREVIIRINMRDELVGNYEQKILHGGVISAVLDLTGGIIAQLNAVKLMDGKNFIEISNRFSKMSTINMRVDYIKPGTGDYFLASGKVINSGNKVSVTKMKFHNNSNHLIAVATGTYMVG